MIVRILNRLGVCSSADTLARSIQYRVREREQECSPDTLTVISADNIDFLHSYARVFCGKQTSSWHGTTVQAVQPKPGMHSTLSAMDDLSGSALPLRPSSSSTQGESTSTSLTSDSSDLRRHTECEVTDPSLRLAGRKRAAGRRSPCSSPSKACRSPAPKMKRRARSGLEGVSEVTAPSSPTYPQPSRPDHHIRPHNLDLRSFQLSPTEEGAMRKLREELDTYILQKHIYSSNCNTEAAQSDSPVVLNIQGYMKVIRPAQTEKSNVVYLHVLDAKSDSKDTLMQVLQDLQHRFIEGQQKEWLVLAGDAKIYDVLLSLKYEYGEELKWLLPYPGDWHLLKNYQNALMKPYFDTGLKELARVSGYPVAAIQNCGKFKRTHHFLIEAWQALYQVMVERFLQSCNETHDTCLPPELISDIVQNAYLEASSGKETDLSTTLSRLHEAVKQSGYHSKFSSFIDKLSAADSTWKFWAQFVFKDALAYVSMYLAIRSGDWELRLASMKLMVPVFSAFDHLTYRKLIAQHLADVLSLPPSVLNYFRKGGFVVSISGHAWHSVAIDEAHEMKINKECKTSIVRPSRDYISRVAGYIPYRTKCLENLREQIFPEESSSRKSLPTSILSVDSHDRKWAANTEAQINLIKSAQLLPLPSSDRGLVNSFTKKNATPEQQHDLLNFRTIGQEEFEKHVAYYILKQASVYPPQRKRRLLTFADRKPSKRQVSQLEKDRRLVLKCLHKKLKWSKQMGQPVDTIAEQYIPIPLALADSSGCPLKGQKSNSTKAIKTRYKDARPLAILNNLPHGWIPDCCMLEGMFMLNTTPLGSHRTFADFAQFLIKRFIVPQFARGTKEVHVLFDNPGRLPETPKYFERKRRDTAATVTTGHACDEVCAGRMIPSKWRADVINCRNCKRNLVLFLTQYFLRNVPKYLQAGKAFYVAGGFEGSIEDTAWFVTSHDSPQPDPVYTCNSEETDTRLWLHVKKTACTRILIRSPDTDIYHIGLPLNHGNQKEIIVQINTYNSKDLTYLHLPALVTAFTNDPDLSSVPSQILPQIFQTIFVATGCDYTSFFSGIGKATFLRYFYQNAEFITSGKGNAPGTLADVGLDGTSFDTGFLAFLRLVGVVYFKKHASGFSAPTPASHFNKFDTQELTPIQKHQQWLDDIRQCIWDRVQFENEMIPSTDALHRHWKRSCWVIDMWHQANKNEMAVRPLTDYGWKVNGDTLTFDWDSDINMEAVKQRVAALLRGCRCKTGCKTARCGCRKKGNTCSEGCECTDCSNTQTTLQQPDIDSLFEVSVEEIITDSGQTDVDDVMDWVFGDYEEFDSFSEPENDEHEELDD